MCVQDVRERQGESVDGQKIIFVNWCKCTDKYHTNTVLHLTHRFSFCYLLLFFRFIYIFSVFNINNAVSIDYIKPVIGNLYFLNIYFVT